MRRALLKVDWRQSIYLVAASFLVCVLAFINRYPFVFSDSGTYMLSSFTLEPAVDRPIGYSFIIRAVTWQSTMWTLVLFQGFMVAWLIYVLLAQLLPTGAPIRKVHLLLLAILVTTTSMPWYAAQIMPDIITPLLGMVIYLILFGVRMTVARTAFLWVFAFFSILSHFSHIVMTVLLLLAVAVYVLVVHRDALSTFSWFKWSSLMSVVAAAVLFATWYNVRHGHRAKLSPSSNVFLAAKMCTGDVMHTFLSRHCAETEYVLCPYANELPEVPTDFIWAPNGIIDRMGMRLEVADTLLAPIVHDLLLDPVSLGMFIRTSIIDSFKQLFQVNAGSGLINYSKDSPPYVVIKDRLPQEQESALHALQAYGVWNFDLVNRVVHLALLVSMVIIGLTWGVSSADHPLFRFVLCMFAWVFLNAVVTGSLANVYDRLQSRVAWLIVLVACLMLAQTAWAKRLWASTSPGDELP